MRIFNLYNDTLAYAEIARAVQQEMKRGDRQLIIARGFIKALKPWSGFKHSSFIPHPTKETIDIIKGGVYSHG